MVEYHNHRCTEVHRDSISNSKFDSGQSNISYAGESRHRERAWKNTSQTGYDQFD